VLNLKLIPKKSQLLDRRNGAFDVRCTDRITEQLRVIERNSQFRINQQSAKVTKLDAFGLEFLARVSWRQNSA
jgi:hypothetical protein